MARLASQCHRTGQPAQPQRHHKQPVRSELLEPSRRKIPRPRCHDDPIERGGLPMTGIAVCAHHPHRPVPGGPQPLPSLLDHHGVDVDTRHRTRGPGQLGQERRVVAGARPDLQHSIAWLEVQLLEHDRDDARLRDRTGRHPLRVAVRDYRLAAVSAHQWRVRDEQVPRHCSHRRDDPRVGQDPALTQPVNHRVAQRASSRIRQCGRIGAHRRRLRTLTCPEKPRGQLRQHRLPSPGRADGNLRGSVGEGRRLGPAPQSEVRAGAALRRAP